MTNYKATIQRLTHEGGNIRENITYNDLLDLETALNEAHAQMPEIYDEQDFNGAGTQWLELIGRRRLYSCFMAEIERRKEAEIINGETPPRSEILARAISNNSEEIITALEETRERVRRESDTEQSQHCRHCIGLLARINELERRLNILEARNIEQESQLIAQIQQPPAYYQ